MGFDIYHTHVFGSYDLRVIKNIPFEFVPWYSDLFIVIVITRAMAALGYRIIINPKAMLSLFQA